MSTWEKIANYCEQVYTVYVDWTERFFECPECGEPIYECDWTPDKMEQFCPICGFNWEDE